MDRLNNKISCLLFLYPLPGCKAKGCGGLLSDAIYKSSTCYRRAREQDLHADIVHKVKCGSRLSSISATQATLNISHYMCTFSPTFVARNQRARRLQEYTAHTMNDTLQD